MADPIAQTVLQDYAAMAHLFALPKLQVQQCAVESFDLLGQDALLDALSAFAPQAGWLTWQSASADEAAMQAWDSWQPSLFARAQAGQIILEGEMLGQRHGAPSSLHLRLQGMQQWRVSYVTALPEASIAQGVTILHGLSEARSYAGKHGVKRLHYQLLWLADVDGAWRPRLSYLSALELA